MDRNGEEITKPLSGSVLAFLNVLNMEANASNLTEGDVRAAFTSLVGTKVGAALLQEKLTEGTKINSYCGTVNWLLQKYEKASDLRMAFSRMGSFWPSPDETLKHFQKRLAASMGNLRSELDLKGQFLFGSSPAAQALLKALKCDFRSSWNDLLAAAESGDILRRRPPRPQPAPTTQHTVGMITAVPSPTEYVGTYCPVQYQSSSVIPEEAVSHAEKEDADVFLAQKFLLAGNRTQRGDITCYLCFRPIHVVVECDLLPKEEIKALLERRSAFLSRHTRLSREFAHLDSFPASCHLMTRVLTQESRRKDVRMFRDPAYQDG